MIARRLVPLLILLVAACGPNYDLVPIQGILSRQTEALETLHAFRDSCAKGAPSDEWHYVCEQALAFKDPDNYLAQNFFAHHFDAYLVTTSDSDVGFVTGYYEPELEGSLKKQGDYIYPLYAAPAGASKDSPYATRREIESGKLLAGKEVLWLKDDVERFFLHIQGSGKVLLPNGKRVTAQFGGKNHQPYTAIGKLLVEREEMAVEEVTMQSIKAWLRAHPEEAEALMWQNDAYTFFTIVDSVAPAKGAQGIPLRAESSLAIDPAFHAYGQPIFVDTDLADGTPYRRLLIAQDTGGAIKGAMRGDIYFGQGAPAAEKAGGLRAEANWFILWPKGSEPHVPSSSAR